MIDIHSHILPEIDDGASDWEKSVEMCNMAVQDGVTIMVATPHMLDGLYNVSREAILRNVSELRKRLKDASIPLEVLAGADVHVDINIVEYLNQGSLVTINDSGKYLLVEFPHDVIPRNVEKLLFSIKMSGVTPIITHPERNNEIQNNIEKAYHWVRSGNLIQVTGASITGEMGETAKKCAHKLLEQELVHVIASDAHSTTWRPPGLSAAKAEITRIYSKEKAQKIIEENPQKIVNGEEIEVYIPDEIVPPKKKKWIFW